MLVHRLFESEEFASWQNGNYRLHIFLDSLDECLVRTISKLLIRELKFRKCPADRLNLRIACRTNKWIASLENDLRQFWGKDAVGVYELAPLRRVDIIEAIRAKGIDIKGFLCEIDRVEAVPLAIKPITLEFLLNTFSDRRSLHATQTDLYLVSRQDNHVVKYI
jgi:predicted NACHT family NTPase